jgi:hypothetical protein
VQVKHVLSVRLVHLGTMRHHEYAVVKFSNPLGSHRKSPSSIEGNVALPHHVLASLGYLQIPNRS